MAVDGGHDGGGAAGVVFLQEGVVEVPFPTLYPCLGENPGSVLGDGDAPALFPSLEAFEPPGVSS